MFEFEKERAKWGLERDHLINQKQEVVEQVDRLERRKETLLRENEKLKNDKTKNRAAYQPGMGAGQAGAPQFGKLNATMFGQTLLKGMGAKENTAASQVFPTGFSKYISDGGQGSDAGKADPTTLPFSSKVNGTIGGAHKRGTSSGAGSFKSGSSKTADTQ